ncbi:hypothetical protein [endosymbiont GvMRE of Glomus versiforme]|nr:hypothetical protein [endosymbiont GvMRE of Glomus versiforme]
MRDTRNCKDCQKKKQNLVKNSKLTNRISFKVSKDFFGKVANKKK